MQPPPALTVPLGLSSCEALMAYDDEARVLLTSLKNGGNRALVTSLADGLAPLLPAGPLAVTWAPTGLQRRRQRGYDQAELLARAVARRSRLGCALLLERLPGPPQVGRSAGERRRHPGFRVIRSVPPAVVVVDDVATTGATLVAAARALRQAGAREIHGLVVARARGA